MGQLIVIEVKAHPKIKVLGFSESAMLLRHHKHDSITAIISIKGHREYPPDPGNITHVLALNFDDVEAPSESDPIEAARLRLRYRRMEEEGLKVTPPTIDHALSIIYFATRIAGIGGSLLCQCHAGISRSPAAAIICLATWLGPGHETDCVNEVLAIRPSAQPHRDLIAFADCILEREGRLIQALRKRT